MNQDSDYSEQSTQMELQEVSEQISSAYQVLISPEIMISELVSSFPAVKQLLMDNYGFHCENCFNKPGETLEQGAHKHGVEGGKFVEMMRRVHEIANA